MAKAIMVQGTMSNVGKSVLCAGLCRVFRQDGYRVAPFKSQNMALNSFITKEGLEMGRAQVMQAEAAGAEPSVRMNPILLKPTSDMGSQVIVNGEVVGAMPAAQYFKYKKSLIPVILEAYESLTQEYDIIVLEGAGSPAEINLKSDDIVNMGMAKLARCPVLMAGDIDRGGVFASLYGTVALLEPREQAMIKGMIINKFRGDVEILHPGLTMLEELTKVPVLGVVPYAHLDLDDEDSLSERFQCQHKNAPLDVAVIRLPRISNFTDFNPLERHNAVGLRYIQRAQELGQPDLIILPGTKNTMDDLRWLRQNGLEAAIKQCVAAGSAFIGICGGFQMLGRILDDPYGVEGAGRMTGMELLSIDTVFSPQKTREQKRCKAQLPDGFYRSLDGCELEGYEIHMGESGHQGLFCVQDRVLGTYLHGLFDSPQFTQGLVNLLLKEKGVTWREDMDLESHWDYKQRQYDTLADLVRSSLDMKQIYQILEHGLN